MGWKGDKCMWCGLPATDLAALEHADPAEFEWHMQGDCMPDTDEHGNPIE